MINWAEFNPLQFWQRGVLTWNGYDNCGIKPGHHPWYQTDTYEQYLKVGNKEFTIEDVTYNINSHGYRSKEFSEINHDAFKILMSGCSETVGIGIPIQLTYSEQLAALIRQRFAIDVEVINMAAGGRSIDYVVRTLFQSVPILRPHYVFCLLPNQTRREYILEEQHLCTLSFGAILESDDPYKEALLTLHTDVWDFFAMVKNIAMIELILHDTPWSWDTWMGDWWKQPGFEAYIDMLHYRNQHLPWHARGKARDNVHSGVPYHRYIANDLITDPRLLLAIDRYRSADYLRPLP